MKGSEPQHEAEETKTADPANSGGIVETDESEDESSNQESEEPQPQSH